MIFLAFFLIYRYNSSIISRKVAIYVEEQFNESTRPVNPRRKKRSKEQIFKETYLPAIIAVVALILIVIFIIGSIVRAVQKNRFEKAENLAESSALALEQQLLEQEASELIAQAEKLMANYDYPAAIAVLNSFSGDLSKTPLVNDKIIECERAQSNMVAWDDPSRIVNLSFQMLIADPARGFANEEYGYAINRNFVTTGEFSMILQQLYDNGYVLVDFDDFISEENGIYKAKTMYLPSGKKPVMLTQTNVNYNYYLVDSDGDKYPDAEGAGFASKLLWDGSQFTCEMVDATGNTVNGAFDLVPILENFIKQHPDFSYRGARATLALTGYNGLFGHRTHPKAATYFGETEYQSAIQNVTVLINALRKTGYKLACYTYGNVSYGDSSLAQIQSDMRDWASEVVPILGKVDILAYAQMTDISKETAYSGEKYEELKEMGFRYFLGFCEGSQTWTTVTDNYVRQGRILVSGTNMAYHSDWFANLFVPSAVLDTARGNIPY